MARTLEIDEIRFGILSAEDIRRQSVVEVNSSNIREGEDGTLNYTIDGKLMAGVYAPAMGGRPDRTTNCCECKKAPDECPGHFGHIELNVPITHPLFERTIHHFLQCICTSTECARSKEESTKLLFTEDQLELWNLKRTKGKRRFKAILTKLEKIDICLYCGQPQPKIAYNPTDGIFTKVYEQQKKNKVSVVIETSEIKDLFDFISDDDVRLLGFDPALIHPRNLIITAFPVIPPCARPCVMADGHICDDDLTVQLLEIIKANNTLHPQSDADEEKRKKALNSLPFRIKTYFDNSQGKAKHTTNKRPIKGLRERLTGKKGQVRSNLMGKRVEFSARTVATADPQLRTDEVGLPDAICKILTFPERVTKYNLEDIKKLVDKGHANYLRRPTSNGSYRKFPLSRILYNQATQLMFGDEVIRGTTKTLIVDQEFKLEEGDVIIRDGVEIPKSEMKYPTRKPFDLQVGDIIDRHLRDNDWVILNRQPTLHKGSMMAFKVKRHPFKTIRINLAMCGSFNADFDGDELNIHVPQSYEALAEIQLLSTPQANIINPKSSKPNVSVVQDSLLGAYRMTRGWQKITKEQFQDMAAAGVTNLYDSKRVAVIRRVLKEKGIDPDMVYSGRGLISLMLPPNMIYNKDNGKMKDEPEVKIYRGVMYAGVLDKTIIGSSQNAITQLLVKEYSPDVALEFVDNIQFITRQWLLLKSFSIGLGDCLISDHIDEKGLTQKDYILDATEKCYIEAEAVENSSKNAVIRESRVSAAINKARDIGNRIANNAYAKDNSILNTVTAGSKGSSFNVSQISGLLGQQNLLGGRIKPSMSAGTRTMPHYPLDAKKMDITQKYESQGFVSHSFIEGLTPEEFFHHCRAGREGICDTATSTARSGYIQRKIMKMLENAKIYPNGSVRDSSGKILQLSYGQHGIDPSRMVPTKIGLSSCNVSRIVDRLNLEEELANENVDEKKNN
jgi:DNA-directed RNA polymerase beta' subunit